MPLSNGVPRNFVRLSRLHAKLHKTILGLNLRFLPYSIKSQRGGDYRLFPAQTTCDAVNLTRDVAGFVRGEEDVDTGHLGGLGGPL